MSPFFFPVMGSHLPTHYRAPAWCARIRAGLRHGCIQSTVWGQLTIGLRKKLTSGRFGLVLKAYHGIFLLRTAQVECIALAARIYYHQGGIGRYAPQVFSHHHYVL